jgi:hypothetical protein
MKAKPVIITVIPIVTREPPAKPNPYGAAMYTTFPVKPPAPMGICITTAVLPNGINPIRSDAPVTGKERNQQINPGQRFPHRFEGIGSSQGELCFTFFRFIFAVPAPKGAWYHPKKITTVNTAVILRLEVVYSPIVLKPQST